MKPVPAIHTAPTAGSPRGCIPAGGFGRSTFRSLFVRCAHAGQALEWIGDGHAIDVRGGAVDAPRPAPEEITPCFRSPDGFSLVELLVVIAILGGLMGLALPAVQRVREAARRTQCGVNLASMGVALTAYESARREFPPGSDAATGLHHAWSSFILPFLDAAAVARRVDYKRPWNADGGNAEIADTILPTYVCPTGIRMFPGKQDYGGVLGVGVMLDPAAALPPGRDRAGVLCATDADHPRAVRGAMITDGLTHTLTVSEGIDRGFAEMDGESRIGNSRWACGSNCFLLSSRVLNTPDVDGFRSHHPGGVHGLFADGRVVFMVDSTPPELLMAACTKDGGESGEGIR